MDMNELNGIIDKAAARAVTLRHKLHEIPEIACQEHKTAALIREVLDELDVRIMPPALGTDTVAMLNEDQTGSNVTLRADIDALPIIEETGVDYASKHEGMMHACGHDGHTAVLLGAAIVLDSLKQELNGSVRFVFQPGEEIRAAGKDLVDSGILKDPKPDMVVAMHGWVGIPVGAISSKPGAMMAASDFFTARIVGRGAHGSKPDEAIDAISAAAHAVQALHSIPSRRISSVTPSVVSVCRIHGGANGNVIPDTVELAGTCRYVDSSLDERMPALVREALEGACAIYGASVELDYTKPYIPLINDAGVVERGKKCVCSTLGADCWRDMETPVMGGEDFAYYIRDYPGAIFWLGMGEDSPSIHNSRFNFRDEAVRNGVAFFTHMVLDRLASA